MAVKSGVKAIVLRQWRSMAMDQARQQGLEVAGVDWLLREVAGLDRLQLHLAQGDLDCPFETIVHLWQQHCEQQTPLQYLVGWTTWRNLRLKVAPGVLIPRPETELLVDLALAALRENPSLAQGEWVDLGTGSGAIPLALAVEVSAKGYISGQGYINGQALSLHGVDCSLAALTIAQANALKTGLPPNQGTAIHWHLGSWFEPFAPWQGQGKISVMLSNPPYIPTGEVSRLAPTVRDHEPSLALDGGPDGLHALEHLIHTAPQYLCPGGLWLVEVMAGQAAIVAAKLAATGQYEQIRSYPDLAGIDRFVQAVIANVSKGNDSETQNTSH